LTPDSHVVLLREAVRPAGGILAAEELLEWRLLTFVAGRQGRRHFIPLAIGP